MTITMSVNKMLIEIRLNPVRLIFESLFIVKRDVPGSNGCSCDRCYTHAHFFKTEKYFEIKEPY